MTASLVSMPLPSWASHLEHKLAPPPLLPVQAFVNTIDLELRTDLFADADKTRAWLADAGLCDADPARSPGRGQPDPAFAFDLLLAIEVRAGIRGMIRHNTDGTPLTPQELRPLERVTSQVRPGLDVTADGQVRLSVPGRPRILADGLAGLLLIIRDAQADGSWDRLKVCGNPDCRWAFYDRSHSRRGAWCEMASCGNRLKNRSLRARRAQSAEAAGSAAG